MEGLQRTKSITLEGSSVGVGEDSSVVPMSRVGQGCLQVLCALCVDQRHSGGCVCPADRGCMLGRDCVICVCV